MSKLPHNSYRVTDTNVIAGEYPYDKNPERGLERIRACLDAGVTHFIDLTRPVDGLAPYASALETEAARRGLKVRHTSIQVPDGGTPSNHAMRDIITHLDAARDSNETVYVHCWGGVGRTGTVVGAYLRHLGHSAEAAIENVEKLFATVSPEKWARHYRTTFHSEAQKSFVRNWSAEAPLP